MTKVSSLLAVGHTTTDIIAARLTILTGCMVTTADLKGMIREALCSGNYFDITPEELANGVYKLPRLAHYDGALDMEKVVNWLKNTIGVTPYMAHAHFRPFLRRSFETSAGARHRVFSPVDLFPGECLPPPSNEALIDFPSSREWTPSRGPRTPLLVTGSATDATADALLAPLGDSASSAASVSGHAPEDTEMVGLEVTTADAPLVTPPSTTA